MLHSFKTQGTKTKTLLTLATVGIISAFLVGSPQHASADQTYVSDPNQALTFSELETGTTTNTIAQTGVSTETPTTVILYHIPLWMIFIHMKMTMNKLRKYSDF
ncbi:MAG: hypothetical protein ACLRUB_00485 [Streptococcus sp.]